ncbi:alpha/beta fold hydrolase [Nocardioides sp. dk4132]|uniref:alpha/beta hydrolase n=1 Tax=unclassified Nocardioides TaxID=2615069 RepID=UPI0012965BE6|nr:MULTISPECIES: alpha/beta fold hydrolase [unclassified Nocardioides]MQW76515.1 alpha/beta fold hydrolase [Nocardioides sp. dk4132]QGA07224.1 alpha/beta fold hydrolase [Nocardioides sp. dk884]
MTIHPLAAPLSAPARPELTGGRRVGVLLSHGFTGQPASVKPWGEHLAALGYAVEVPRLPGHGTTWQEMNTTRWEDWYGELARVFDGLCLENDAVVVGGLSMGGALALRLAADHPDRVAGVVVVNPAVATRRLDVRLLPVLQHVLPSMPGIVDDISKPGVTEHGYPRTPLRAARSMFRAWPELVTALPRVTAPLLYLRSEVDHVVDDLSEPLITERVSSTDLRVVRLADSYHVATLDHDAPRIFEETADFVARVSIR